MINESSINDQLYLDHEDETLSHASINANKQRIVMLTTIDNPFDPFVQFDDWFAFDMQKGYNCCGYLARVEETSELLSDEINAKRIEDAIDDICRLNVLGVFKKVVKFV